MLAPKTRSLYSEILRAPPGFFFDAGVATTYSLDLQGLLIFPVALATPVDAEPDELLRSPVRLLDGIRKTMARLTVFCHEAQVGPPSAESPLYGLLEDSFFEVRSKNGAFHPKLWLLRFKNDDGETRLRAVVLSRNMTFDRSWDVVVSLDGTPFPRQTVAASYGLRDLVQALPRLARGQVPIERARLLDELADDAQRTRFEPPQNLDRIDPVFQAIGLDGKRWAPDGDGKTVLVVSPFVRGSALKEVAELASVRRILISRQDELDDVSSEALAPWECSQMADAVEIGDDACALRTATRTPSGLHAKAYCIEHGAWATWWFGSANCTAAAFGGSNVELMVKLEGHHKDVGIQAFLDGGFQGLLVEYEPPTEPRAQDDQGAAKDLAESIREMISAADLVLQCVGVEDFYNLDLTGRIDLPCNGDVVANAWPVSLPTSAAVDARPLSEGGVVTFGSLAAASLTRLIAFAVTAKVGEATVTLEFVLKLDAQGFPEDRHARILRNIISNRSAFFQYLRYLLGACDGILGAFERQKRGRDATGDSASQWLPPEAAVLEELVKLVRRHPERLIQVDGLVRDLRASPECCEVVPEQFWETWRAVRAYLKMQGHELAEAEW